MKVAVDEDRNLTLSEVYLGVGIKTDAGVFAICQRDSGIEIRLDDGQWYNWYDATGPHLMAGKKAGLYSGGSSGDGTDGDPELTACPQCGGPADARLDYGQPFDAATAKPIFFDCTKTPEQSRDEFYSLDTARQHMLNLYAQKINDRVTARIVQLVDRKGERERSQFLALVINDETTGRWISLRLSTFRKVLKFVERCDFIKARRLRDDEKRNLQGRADRKGWLGRLGDQVKRDLEDLFDKEL